MDTKCFFCKEDMNVNNVQQPIMVDGDLKNAHMYCGHDPIAVYEVHSDGNKVYWQGLEDAQTHADSLDTAVRLTALSMTERMFYSKNEFEGE